jgi:transposase-like protein
MNPYTPPESSVDIPIFAKGERIAVKCPHCQHEANLLATKSFLGFKKLTCSHCNQGFNYPLFRAYRITYWMLLMAEIIYFFILQPASPASIFILMTSYVVLTDIYLLWRRKSSRAE